MSPMVWQDVWHNQGEIAVLKSQRRDSINTLKLNIEQSIGLIKVLIVMIMIMASV